MCVRGKEAIPMGVLASVATTTPFSLIFSKIDPAESSDGMSFTGVLVLKGVHKGETQ